MLLEVFEQSLAKHARALSMNQAEAVHTGKQRVINGLIHVRDGFIHSFPPYIGLDRRILGLFNKELMTAAGTFLKRPVRLLRRNWLGLCENTILHGHIHLHDADSNRHITAIDSCNLSFLAQGLDKDHLANSRVAACKALPFRLRAARNGKILTKGLAAHLSQLFDFGAFHEILLSPQFLEDALAFTAGVAIKLIRFFPGLAKDVIPALFKTGLFCFQLVAEDFRFPPQRFNFILAAFVFPPLSFKILEHPFHIAVPLIDKGPCLIKNVFR